MTRLQDHPTEVRTFRLHKPVVLVGMMGSGKTANGKALAARLDVPFLDSDAEIEQASQMTIAEMFERHGEAYFRDGESKVLARLIGEGPAILSTGGGAFLAKRNRDIIHEKGVSLCLEADLDLLWDRVKHKDTRPLLRTENPRKTLEELFRNRAPIYAKASLSAQAERDLSIEDMNDRVLSILLTRPDILEVVA